MSSSFWNVKEHIIQASHTRSFSRGIQDEMAGGLRLAVKQYVPLTNPDPQRGAISIIFAHGVGSSKECYEPFFDDLLQSGLRIRAIWAADAAHSNASYVLNEELIGDEPGFCDASRDFTHMINHFQQLMPPPLVGIGQSAGSLVIADIAIKHPRLLAGLVLMEPTVGPGLDQPSDLRRIYSSMAVLSAKRRDTWTSREAARKSLRRTAVYGRYDPRAFERMIEFELRDIPKSSTSSEPSVTLTTPKQMEVCTFLRPDPPLAGYPESPDYATEDGDSFIANGFYRPELPLLNHGLPSVYPSTLYVWGKDSPIANSEAPQFCLETTGSGRGGRGGSKSGQVQEAWVEGATHFLPLEKPAATAQIIAPWLKAEISRWDKERGKKQSEPSFQKQIHPEYLARLARL
ncbi:hypothetical protein MMC32_004528 [Xylographa parallela]|nr:hypothetical protein [Xylographa parallela]